MGHLCLWDVSELEYDGLCSHSALAESGYIEDCDLSKAERAERAALVKQREKDRDAEKYRRAMDENPDKLREQKRTAQARRLSIPAKRVKTNANRGTLYAQTSKDASKVEKILSGRRERDHKRAAKNKDAFKCDRGRSSSCGRYDDRERSDIWAAIAHIGAMKTVVAMWTKNPAIAAILLLRLIVRMTTATAMIVLDMIEYAAAARHWTSTVPATPVISPVISPVTRPATSPLVMESLENPSGRKRGRTLLRQLTIRTGSTARRTGSATARTRSPAMRAT